MSKYEKLMALANQKDKCTCDKAPHPHAHEFNTLFDDNITCDCKGTLIPNVQVITRDHHFAKCKDDYYVYEYFNCEKCNSFKSKAKLA